MKISILNNLRGKKLFKQKLEIDMMSLRDLECELNYRFCNIKSEKDFDERFVELVDKIFDMEYSVPISNMSILFFYCGLIKKENLKLFCIEKFADKFDTRDILKYINKNSTDEFDKKVIQIIFSKNFEKINFYSLFPKMQLDFALLVMESLPDDKKYIFLYEYLKIQYYIPMFECKELVKVVIENVPLEIINSDLELENIYDKKVFFDVNFKKLIMEKLDIFDSKDELDDDIYNLSKEQLYQKLNNENITDNEKIRYFILICNITDVEELFNFFINLSDSEKLLILNVKHEKFSECFKLYSQRIFDSINDEKLKKSYKIQMVEKIGNYDEVFEILTSNNYYMDNIELSKEMLLHFSDEKLNYLYHVTSNQNLRILLVTLSRKMNRHQLSWYDVEISEEELKKINEKYDDYILFNNENFLFYLKNFKSIEELANLLYIKFIDDVSFDELIKVYMKFLNTFNHEGDDIRKIKGYFLYLLNKKMSFDDLFSLIELKIKKNDIEFIVNNFSMKLGKLNDDQLQKYIEKIALIDDLNIKNIIYDKLISCFSLTNKFDFISNCFNNLVDCKDLDFSKRYYCLSKYIELYVNDKDLDKDWLVEIINKLKKLNIESNREKYNDMYDFDLMINMFEKSDVDERKILHLSSCMPYLYSNVVYKKIQELYETNHNVMNTITGCFLADDTILKIDEDLLSFISRYNVSEYKFSNVFSDSNKKLLFINAYNRLKEIKTYSEGDAIKLVAYIASCLDNNYLNDDSNLSDDKLDLLLSLAFSKSMEDEFYFLKKYVGDSAVLLNNYSEVQNDVCYRRIHGKLNNRVSILDSFGTRFFGLNYDEMTKLSSKYSSDVLNLINFYEQKPSLTLEEQNELMSLKLMANIKYLLSIDDSELLVQLYDELDNNPEFTKKDHCLGIIINENVRHAFSKEYLNNLYVLKETDKQKQQVDGIDVYCPDNFNMLIHVVAAYGNFKLIDENNLSISSKELWNHVENRTNHILCTSLISNSNLCYFKSNDEDTVIFGFNSFTPDSVLMSAPYDLASYTSVIESDLSVRIPLFRTAKELIKNTRWNHNEVCLERRIADDKSKNIEPDYIICFDKINDSSKKVARDFNIPIVYIDSKKFAKNQSLNFDKMFDDFEKSKDPSIISELVSCYQTSLLSFSKNHIELVKKFFNPDNINTKFQRIWDIILEEEKKGDKIRAANCYIAFYEAFKNEIDLNHSVGLEPEDMSKNKFSIKKFAFISKQKYFEAKKYLESISVSKCSDDIKVQSTTSFKQSYIMSDSFDDSQDYQSTVRRYR